MEKLKKSNAKLLLATFIRFILVFIILGTIFFLTAGSFSYINGWIYLCTILITLGSGFILIYKKDKALLEKRLKTNEKEKKQKAFIGIAIVLITSLYTLPGLDYRFKWSNMPIILVIIGEALLLFGYIMNMSVMMKNSFASRVVEIQEKQKVIDKGLYSIVRHPMYLSMILIYLGTSLILGSYYSLIPSVLLFFALGFRAKNEEKVLIEGLEGYSEYMKKVKYRLIPFVW